LSRLRALAKNAPAEPTSASTAVGFSGESVQPVCAWATIGNINTAIATSAMRAIFVCEMQIILFIAVNPFNEVVGRR
jgi:hypothetical protein